MSVTYHLAVPLDRVEGGDLVPGEAKEAPSRDAARRRAEAMAAKHAGALAFSLARRRNKQKKLSALT